MALPPVRIHHHGEVDHVVLTRPDRANALDAITAGSVAELIESSEARVVLLTGQGRAFCAGGDLDELERWSTRSPEEVGKHLYESFQRMIRAIRASDAVVIAVVNGAAVGAGMDLALACDLRIAGESAKFGQVWVGLGVIPGTGGAYLTQALAGPTAAARMLLTGEIISAQEAFRLGLVNEVVADDRLWASAEALAERILAHPPDGVIANKRAMVLASHDALEAALTHAAEVQPHRFTSEEFRVAVAVAKERRSKKG